MSKHKSKYIGKIFEGRWMVISVEKLPEKHNRIFILENIYNKEQMRIWEGTFYKVLNETFTISNLRKWRIFAK